MNEEKLEKQVEDYSKIAKENPNVDIGLLMASALQNQKSNAVTPKAKRWAYLVSVGLPPFGLLFALRYYFAEQDDAKQVAWVCVILTVVSVFIFWLSAKLFFSGSGASLEQIQQIKPSDIQQLYQ